MESQSCYRSPSVEDEGLMSLLQTELVGNCSHLLRGGAGLNLLLRKE